MGHLLPILLVSASTSVGSAPCPHLVTGSWRSATFTCLYKAGLRRSGRSCGYAYL